MTLEIDFDEANGSKNNVDDKKERRPLFPLHALQQHNPLRICGSLFKVCWRDHKYMLLLFLLFCGAFYSRNALRKKTRINWEKGLIHNLPTCQSTNIQPLRDECPTTCEAYRPNEVLVTNTSTAGITREREIPLYHISVFWAFGQSGTHQKVGMGELPEKTAYDVGVNFQCSEEFVRSFSHAVEHINYEATDKIPGIESRGVRRMQLDLSNYCCLTRQQAFMAQHLIQKWLYENYPFDISMEFDRLECWRTEADHVTNMIMASTRTQHALMELNHELRDLLKDHDIPIWVERESQIPFHVPVGGINFRQHHANNAAIATTIASIYELVYKMSNQMGRTWTGGNNQPMRINHPPQVSKNPVAHGEP